MCVTFGVILFLPQDPGNRSKRSHIDDKGGGAVPLEYNKNIQKNSFICAVVWIHGISLKLIKNKATRTRKKFLAI